MRALRRYGRRALFACALSVSLLAFLTWREVDATSLTLRTALAEDARLQVLDRNGEPLGVSYQNRFNTLNTVPLHRVPEFLRQAFIISEDRDYFSHDGVDWSARVHALWQNIRARKAVRGASTITEQAVRILHPRARTLWSRWVEGFEAYALERRFSKGEILEFYLNQVPYAAQRRGIAQAARYYFNRDVGTLTRKEMLALAVLPRAPGAYDLYRHPERIEPLMNRLAQAMQQQGALPAAAMQEILAEQLALQPPAEPVDAGHFVRFIRESVAYEISENGVLTTTLDANLQRQAQALLNERLKSLRRKQAHNGALLVADHRTGEILAWVVVGADDAAMQQNTPAYRVDAVRAPRQPGSSLKPFLYALALESGWSPATVLDDSPMSEAIGVGMHAFNNYSHTFYGPICLREALGNSLNIPALRTIQFVGVERYLEALHALGFVSLNREADFYREGLALGNGEVTLLEEVQAYAALANRGVFMPLTPLKNPPYIREKRQVYTPEAASLIGNILSDPWAREREFGAGSILNLPVQTAVKTGTSTDYRDAWAVGYDAHYVVGIWIGNLDGSPMDGITGSTGPALTLRGVFARLAQREKTQPLYLSPRLEARQVCTRAEAALGEEGCYPRSEYFLPGTAAQTPVTPPPAAFALTRPTEGLQIAYDPRVPAQNQAFEFSVAGARGAVAWTLNGERIADATGAHYLWPLKRGSYTLAAAQLDAQGKPVDTDSVHFVVK